MVTEPFIEITHPQYLQLTSWKEGKENIISGFTTKKGGASLSEFTSFNLGLHVNDDNNIVSTNRKLLSYLLKSEVKNWVCAEQIHDNKIVKVTDKNAGSGVFNFKEGLRKTDGLYTTTPNLLLILCYADCVPLYFYDPKRMVVGAAHAGWKGSVKDIAGEMIRTWEINEGVNPKDIQAVIGPSIGACCYIVDDFVKDAVNSVLLNSERELPYKEISKGQYRLDLKRLNELLMIQAGIPSRNISISSYCTSCETDLFFSHRRDNGMTGRMVSYIGLKEG